MCVCVCVCMNDKVSGRDAIKLCMPQPPVQAFIRLPFLNMIQYILQFYYLDVKCEGDILGLTCYNF